MKKLIKLVCASAILVGASVSVLAQVNTNTTIQSGRVNTNDSSQQGKDNDNATHQTGKDNANRSRQSGDINTNQTGQFGGGKNYNESEQKENSRFKKP